MLAKYQELAFDSTMINIDLVPAVDPVLRNKGNIWSGIPGWFPALTTGSSGEQGNDREDSG